ncbi:MAG: NAD-glutamate dehydrogenase, partial [Phycisphaeraceae bacterium]|nr:NAD-glutamate dehydrogenase [Phycisphaeraceae bacterium]
MDVSAGIAAADEVGPRLEKVVERVVAAGDEASAECRRAFARAYFRGAPPEDLLDRSIEHLVAICGSHFGLLQQRTPGQPALKIERLKAQETAPAERPTVIQVVHDDMPFITDSVRMAVNRRGLTTRLMIHPVLAVVRDKEGALNRILAPGETEGEATTESVIHCEIDTPAGNAAELEKDLRETLADVRAAVVDWAPMREKLTEACEQAAVEAADEPWPQRDEELAFLQWLADDHFTFLGYRHYRMTEDEQGKLLCREPATGLGILRPDPDDPADDSDLISRRFDKLSDQACERALGPGLLVITKSNTISRVHRPVPMDYIGVKEFNEDGEVVGEHRFIGLFTATAYHHVPAEIPLLRRKCEQIMERSGFRPDSHAGRTLEHILDTFPRDDLFQMPVDRIYETALGILHLQERQRVRLFLHPEIFDRYVTCLVFLPRDRFHTRSRKRIER